MLRKLYATIKNDLTHWGLHTIVVFERAPHAVLFTLMAAKAINAHQCFALRVRSTLWNGH